MANHRKSTPKNDSERKALKIWRQGRPYTSMRVLLDAGYDAPQRLEFLRHVVGLTDAGEAVMYAYYQTSNA